MNKTLRFLSVPLAMGMLFLAASVPAFAAGPPGPPDTSKIPNQDPSANDTGHKASCQAEGSVVNTAPGALGQAPSYDALSEAVATQCK